MKLTVQIAVFPQAIAVQVLEQEGSFNLGRLARVDGFSLTRSAVPELSTHSFYIRGNDSTANKRVLSKNFHGVDDRNDYLERIYKVMNAFAASRDARLTLRDLGHTHIILMESEDE